MHATPKQRQSGATAPEQFEGGTTGVTGRAQPGETQLPNRARNGVFVPTHQVHDLFPALVTPEEFIRAFSGLRHSHAVVAREFGEEIDRHADRIRDGLVLQVDHAGKEIEEVPLIENALMVNSPDAGCESTSKRQFAFTASIVFVVTNGESLYPLGSRLGKERCIGARVDSAREKYSDRNIADGAQRYAGSQFRQQAFCDLFFRNAGQRCGVVKNIPVPLFTHLSTRVDREEGARPQFFDAFEQSVGSGCGYEREVVKQSFFVDGTRLIGILEQGFDLRGKGDSSVMNAVVERLDADPVSDEPEPARLCIPQSDGKHAAEFLETSDAPLLKSMQNHFGVRVMGFPAANAEHFELAPDLGMVVDFAVEDDLQRSVAIAHGLGSSIGQINDGQAAMSQSHAAVGRNP